MGRAIAFVVFLALALGGCAMLPPQACPAGMTRAATAELFFGRNVGASEGVSDAAWKDFVDTEIAPRFPDGFTAGDADGGWRSRDGTIIRERSKRLFIVLAGKADEQAKLEAIRAAYKVRFHQESVMLFEGEGCVSF